MNTCSCCGQTLPIEHNLEVNFSGNKLLFLKRLRIAGENGCTRKMLFEALYGNHVRGDGGAESLNIISVYVCQINDKMKEFDLPHRIENKRTTGQRAIYWLRGI